MVIMRVLNHKIIQHKPFVAVFAISAVTIGAFFALTGFRLERAALKWENSFPHRMISNFEGWKKQFEDSEDR